MVKFLAQHCTNAIPLRRTVQKIQNTVILKVMCKKFYHENLAEHKVFFRVKVNAHDCTENSEKQRIYKDLRSYSNVQETLPRKLSGK